MTTHYGDVAYFYVRIPDGQNIQWRLRHADETVQTAGGYFKRPSGEYLQEPDGTYEVRAVAPSNTDVVRSMLRDHEGLIIEREESSYSRAFADLFAPLTEYGRSLADLFAQVTERW